MEFAERALTDPFILTLAGVTFALLFACRLAFRIMDMWYPNRHQKDSSSE